MTKGSAKGVWEEDERGLGLRAMGSCLLSTIWSSIGDEKREASWEEEVFAGAADHRRECGGGRVADNGVRIFQAWKGSHSQVRVI